MISFDDFKKLEIRVGRITSAERVEGSEKLIKLGVSFGEHGERQVVAGIGLYFADTAALVERKVAFAFNLEPRSLMGLESQGMVLAAGEGDSFSLLSVDSSVPEGSIVR